MFFGDETGGEASAIPQREPHTTHDNMADDEYDDVEDQDLGDEEEDQVSLSARSSWYRLIV